MHDRSKRIPGNSGLARALIIASIVLGVLPAEAQSVRSSWWKGLPSLTKKDIELAQTKARVELTGKPIGTVASWRNPKSGNAGTVRLVSNFEWQGNPCRKVVHSFQPVQQEKQVWEFSVCDIKGEWKWPVPPKKL
jgi:surface antigen